MLATQFNLAAMVPELVKQLAAGAIAAPKQPLDDEEDEMEEDDDPDDGEPDA